MFTSILLLLCFNMVSWAQSEVSEAEAMEVAAAYMQSIRDGNADAFKPFLLDFDTYRDRSEELLGERKEEAALKPWFDKQEQDWNKAFDAEKAALDERYIEADQIKMVKCGSDEGSFKDKPYSGWQWVFESAEGYTYMVLLKLIKKDNKVMFYDLIRGGSWR